MKYLKLFGLAAIAAAALMAFVGASTASAETTLCKETESLANCYGKGTKVAAHTITPTQTEVNGPNTHAVLTSSLSEPIECNGTISGEIETATTPSGKAAATWENCTEGWKATTVTEGTITVHHDPTPETGKHNGTVTIKGFVVKLEKAFTPTCYYGGEVHGTLTHSGNVDTPATIHITQNVKKQTEAPHGSSFLCPAEATWHATYQLTEPKPVYVSTGV